MTSVSDRALAALRGERELRGTILVPEWSEYGDVPALLESAINARVNAAQPAGADAAPNPSREQVVQLLSERLVEAGLVTDTSTGVDVLELILAGEVETPRIDLLQQLARELEIPSDDLVKPFRVYYRQLTLADTQKINRLADGDDHKSMAYMLVYALEDENGNKVFTKEHLPDLMRAPASLMARLSTEVSRRPNLRDSVKKS